MYNPNLPPQLAEDSHFLDEKCLICGAHEECEYSKLDADGIFLILEEKKENQYQL